MIDETIEEASPAKIEAWARLLRSSATVLEQVEIKLKAAGFPPLAWYDVLLELRRAEGGRLRPVEVEKRTLLAQYNVSRLIDRLASAGFVEKRKSPEDGRGVVVALTAKGSSLLEDMWPVYKSAIQSEFGCHLSEDEAAEIFRLLGKFLPGEQAGYRQDIENK
ncbi:MarR family winged helix-turn-helix transcriptional regulator [Roseibium sp. SCP14]|uniref:MarR family winged helix-turn-helix transcriptional regulator n=1 Tax=Roseibium sp. SCP14 TaxID=3141375 RepID=UPI00333D3965